MFSRRSAWRAALVLAAACWSAPPAQAGAVSYTNYASWSAAMAGGSTDAAIPDPGKPGASDYVLFGSGTASVNFSGVIFSTSTALADGSFYNIGVGISGDPAVLSSQTEGNGVADILTSLPGIVTGFALNYGTVAGIGVTFRLPTGDMVTQGSTEGGNYAVPDFLGIIDTTPSDPVSATSSDDILSISDLADGSSGWSMPEPATGLLVAGGLLGVALRRRRRVN